MIDKLVEQCAIHRFLDIVVASLMLVLSSPLLLLAAVAVRVFAAVGPLPPRLAACAYNTNLAELVRVLVPVMTGLTVARPTMMKIKETNVTALTGKRPSKR